MRRSIVEVKNPPSPQPSPFNEEGEDIGTRQQSPRPVGEVVQATTTGFVAQCRRLYDAPPLGTLVRSGDQAQVYGIVGDVRTQSIDPGRHPIAMGEDDDTVEDVYLRNPQLNRLLATEFHSIVVGFRENDRLHRYLAPLPPRIHTPVFSCDQQEALSFSQSLDFLSILLASPAPSPDDVVASFLRQASLCHPKPESFLVDAGKELATLLTGQMQRLNALLRRLSA